MERHGVGAGGVGAGVVRCAGGAHTGCGGGGVPGRGADVRRVGRSGIAASPGVEGAWGGPGVGGGGGDGPFGRPDGLVAGSADSGGCVSADRSGVSARTDRVHAG